MNEKPIPNKAVLWLRAMDPDPKVFTIGCMLVDPNLNMSGWKRVRDLILQIVTGEVWEIFGGAKVYKFHNLRNFMLGRVNEKKARILELLMAGNVFKDLNFFQNALDIVCGIIELEEWVMPGIVFSHNEPPSEELPETILLKPTTINMKLKY